MELKAAGHDLLLVINPTNQIAKLNKLKIQMEHFERSNMNALKIFGHMT